MKKKFNVQIIADFIVKQRNILLAVIMAATVLCGILTMHVPVNTDMTKYLAEDSNMQQGLTIMDTWFPDVEEDASYRVMIDDLKKTEKKTAEEKLESIPYVSSVDFDANSEDYNKDNHTLYILNTKCEYSSEEVASIEAALESDFAEYNIHYAANETQATSVPIGLLALALGVMMIVLFVMCNSWLEPILFVATIGVAVVINLGTNIIFPYAAEITVSMGPILQLALSMDYSIILMNRYRQECTFCQDRPEAMKSALAKSFSSIASSCITTVVGLLALVFFNFILGPELGIILAKGVFISMICVFVVLPFLILKFDKAIEKSKKKSPHIPMGLMAKFSHAVRYVMPGLFLALFVTFSVLQNSTGISFTEGNPDPIADVFPKDNTIALIYNNDDENNVDEIIQVAEDNEHVLSLVGYRNTLGDERTAEDMSSAIATMSDGVKIDENMVKLLYYMYHSGKSPSVTAEDFITFIKEDVLENQLLSEYMDDSLLDSSDYLDKFADKQKLTSKMTSAQMADFFGIDQEDLKMLYLYYFTEYGGVETGTMTLPQFVDFLLNTVAEDEMYSGMLNAETLSQLEMMQSYLDVEKMTALKSYSAVAETIGMGEEDAKLLYVYYFAQQDSFAPAAITMDEFISYLINDAAANPTFSSYIDSASLAQMDTLAALANKEALQKDRSAAEMSEFLGVDESMVNMVYIYHGISNASEGMTDWKKQQTKAELAEFLGLPGRAIQKIFDAAGSTSDTMSVCELLKLSICDSNVQSLLAKCFCVRLMPEIWDCILGTNSAASGKMSVQEFVDFIMSKDEIKPLMSTEQLSQLELMQTITGYVLNDTGLSYSQLADLLGISHADAKLLLTYKDAQEGSFDNDHYLSIKQVVDFIMDNEKLFAAALGDNADSLKTVQTLVNAAVEGRSYSAAKLAKLLNMDSSMAEDVYLLYRNACGNTGDWVLTPQMFLDFTVNNVLHNDAFSNYFNDSTAEELKTGKQIVDAVVSGKAYSALEMSELLSGFSDQISESSINMLYLYYAGINNSEESWTMTIQQMFNYLCDEVMDDDRFTTVFDRETKEKLLEAKRDLEDGLAQIQSENYSRLVITTDFPLEAEETSAFIASLDSLRKAELVQASYIVGESAMVYEMENSFPNEFTLITIITAVAIMAVVLASFKKLILAVILTLVVQGGVFVTVTVIGWQSGTMYYLALLIVQSILMGATIDYGIVLSTYYYEYRQSMDITAALKAAYEGAIHTIATSGLILILATAILGAFSTVAITAQVCSALSVGTIIAVTMILLILPGMLVFFDKQLAERKTKQN